ncbi:MAG: ATP-binding protein [Bacteroidota bacterium]
MKKPGLQFKIGVLLTFAVIILLATGFLSYRSMSSIVASIHTKAKPGLTFIVLKDLETELEKVENSVRLYTYIRDEEALAPYYELHTKADNFIYLLREDNRDNQLMTDGIDTLYRLIEKKYIAWSDMIQIHENRKVEDRLRELSRELMKEDTGRKQEEEDRMGLLRRIFSGASNKEEDTIVFNKQEIARKIAEVEREERFINARIGQREIELAETSRKLTEKVYGLIEELEKNERQNLEQKARMADKLAAKTYLWLGLFTLAATLLALTVLFTIARYVKKTMAVQKALQHSKTEAEQLAAAKESFLANMSHEIRTPLTAITGFIEQINLGPGERENEKKLGVLRSSSRHLLQIVNDVLDYSRLESGNVNLRNEHFLVEDIIEEMHALFINRAKENNSTLEYFIDDKAKKTYYGDSHRLKQIIFNLLSNAVKFTKNGNIIISVQAPVSMNQDETQILQIIVEDNGIGIPREKLKEIFNDFTQATPEISKKYGGTGLGLSIVKKLIHLFGGEIHIDSSRGKGTVFRVKIPFQKGNLEKVNRKQPVNVNVPPEFSSLKILVADDEEYNLMLFQTILNKWNLYHEEVTDGQQIIDKVSEKKYDLLLIDIRMPGMTGIEALKIIRENMRISTEILPVIGLTATPDLKEYEDHVGKYFNLLIQKPFTETQLLKAIHETLSLESSLTEIQDSNDNHDNTHELKNGNVNLEELKKMAGNDPIFYRDMLHQFITSTSDGISFIKNAIINCQYSDIREMAHKISSPCRHLGAKSLLSNIKELEKVSTKNPEKEELKNLISSIENEFTLVKYTIEQHLAEIHN